MNTKDNLRKFDAKSYEAIFAGYSNTSKAYGVFNRSTLTIKSMHIKLEEFNTLVKNILEIDSLGEDMEKLTLKDLPLQENDKSKDDEHGEVQEVKVKPTQPLSKDWRFTTHYPKDLIIGDVSKG